MSRDLALYTSKNDNFLFQNQQWLSWQLQPTQPFPSDAGSFSSLTYNIYHTACCNNISHITPYCRLHSIFFLPHQSSLFSLSLPFQIHQPRIFSTFTFLPNSPASHFPISLSIPSKFLTYPLSPPLHPKDWAPETGIKMICSIYETIYSQYQNFNAFGQTFLSSRVFNLDLYKKWKRICSFFWLNKPLANWTVEILGFKDLDFSLQLQRSNGGVDFWRWNPKFHIL